MPRSADANAYSDHGATGSTGTWRERILLALWALAAAGFVVWCWNTGFFGPVHLAGGAALILALALLARSGLVRVLGPVLVYDVLRSARRGRFILLRWLYAIGLLLLLLWVYAIWRTETFYSRQSPTTNEFRELARLAEQYFIAFSITQFCAVVLLTPAYVAGGIAEEKEKKTLEFLLATDLENREIIFGKLVSRLGNLALFILTGLPVLSLMQFFGGIDPGLLLASFAATAVTAFSLAGLSILNSVLRRRARDAIILTYVAAIGYLAATGATQVLKLTLSHYGNLYWLGIDWVTLFNWFHAGNPVFGIYAIGMTLGTGGSLDSVIGDELRSYAIFHSIVGVASITWAVLRLRSVALNQSAVVKRKRRRLAPSLGRRRPVGIQPMIWKELWIEGRLRIGAVGRVLVAMLIAVGFVPVMIILYVYAFEHVESSRYSNWWEWLGAGIDNLWRRWDDVGQGISVWLRVHNVVISTLMLLGVAVRAAGSIGSERDRDTLLSLMTTPLTTNDILWAKWLGSLWSVRGFLWWLGSVWLIAILLGGVNPVAFILHSLAWLTPAMCFASIGLWISTGSKTTLRATTWTIAAAIFAGGGHWLCMGMCCYTPYGMLARGSGNSIEPFLYSELAMTPPVVFAWDAFREGNDLAWPARNYSFLVYVIIAMVIWSVLALVFWSLALARFNRLTHRGTIERVPSRSQAPMVKAVR